MKEVSKKAKKFTDEVAALANKYGVNYFVITDGIMRVSNNGNPAINAAREAFIRWEKFAE